MFSFHWISVLLISVTFYTYSANIVFWCDLAFNQRINLGMPFGRGIAYSDVYLWFQ